ncbi:response regulator [Sphingomonas corticis]|jgi:DNA-binding response OmpR family regulator|uniref:Response regulator n=1 Tax=Sphingomonas corticis TaxID=2722791 RepID=A0ABX1CK65_9SPHN|nr:response regulator [Sphingomonas corticis]NJR77148.1 response regulator [Sphingomonas corticis]
MLFAKKKPTLVRLLLVEDEPLVAFDAEHLLTDQGYEIVATVDRVADAVAIIGDGQAIDLVLADVNLADGNGVDVARAAQARGIPVMFVTGQCPAEAEALAIGCLAKPYPQRTLLAAIGAVEAQVAGKPPRRLPGGFRLFPVSGGA